MSCYAWGYCEDNGPVTWSQKYPLAAGQNQSPIDIRTQQDLRKEIPNACLSWKYSKDTTETLKNTGSSWKVECKGADTELKGGPLEGVYQLEQFHCHWGKHNKEGSEHTVDGVAYAGELHFVHRNTKYATAAEAVKYPDGLCVVGIFLKPGKHNDELDKITSLMPKIIYKDQAVNLKDPLDIRKMIPEKCGYYTYNGSLTTPPCSECVIWAVFQQPIEVSCEQLDTFRTLKIITKDEEVEGGYMQENFRPTLPIGDRTIVNYVE